jgi:hypothetical protein
MEVEVMNNLSDGAPPLDRFLLQSFPSARFPSFYERDIERLTIDLVDHELTFVSSTAVPTNLTLPFNGYALVGIQGGSALISLDYNASGTLQTLNPVPEPSTLLLLGTTAAGLGLARWRQRRHKQQP